jgi:TRAP transporter TAXI family solute receptor
MAEARPKRAAPGPGTRRDETGSLGKALTVLRCFVDGQEEWGVREIAAALGQPASSVHRLLRILRREGFLQFEPGKQKYRVGIELFRIAAVLRGRLNLAEIADPVMKDLAAATGESVWLALYEADRGRVAYVAGEASAQRLRLPVPIGRVAELGDDIAGRVVLAFVPETERRGRISPRLKAELAETRLRGWAFESDQDGAILIAAPVLDAADRPIAALLLAVPRQRFREDALQTLAAKVVGAAERVSQGFGARFLGGASAGSWHDGLEIITGLMRSNVAGLVSTPSLGGGMQNLSELQSGGGAYCMTTAASLDAAYRGRAPFKGKHDKLRSVMSLSQLELHIIARRGVAARGIRDLRGLRISPGLVGFSTAFLFRELLSLAGLSEEAVRRAGGDIVYFDYPEAKRQLEAGHIDATVWLTGVPNMLYAELARAERVRLVGVEPDLIAAVVERSPAYHATEIPAGTYPGQDRSVATLAVNTVLATTARRHTNEVRAVCETVFSRREELTGVSSAYRVLDREFATSGLTVPLHDGAARYWGAAPMRSSTKRRRAPIRP